VIVIFILITNLCAFVNNKKLLLLTINKKLTNYIYKYNENI